MDFVTGQHQWTQNPITEMAPRYDHDHVRVVDHILDFIGRRHLPRHQRVVQRSRPCHSQSARLVADVQRCSHRQRQYYSTTVPASHSYHPRAP